MSGQSCRDLPDRQQVEQVRKDMQSLLRSFDSYFRTSTEFQAEWKGKEKKYNNISAEFAAFAKEWKGKEKKYNNLGSLLDKVAKEWKGKEKKYNDSISDIKKKLDDIKKDLKNPNWWKELLAVLVPQIISLLLQSVLFSGLQRLVNWTFDEQSGLSYYIKYIAEKSNVINGNINKVITWQETTYVNDQRLLYDYLNQKFLDINSQLADLYGNTQPIPEIYRGLTIANDNIISSGTQILNKIDGIKIPAPVPVPDYKDQYGSQILTNTQTILQNLPKKEERLDLNPLLAVVNSNATKLDKLTAIDFLTKTRFDTKIDPLANEVYEIGFDVDTANQTATDIKIGVDLLPSTVYGHVNDGFRNFRFNTFLPEVQGLKNWIRNNGGGTQDDTCCNQTKGLLNDLFENLGQRLDDFPNDLSQSIGESLSPQIEGVGTKIDSLIDAVGGGGEQPELGLLVKIYQILGGDSWYEEGISASKTIDPTVSIQETMGSVFNEDKKATKESVASNIVQYFEKYLTLFFLRAGYEEYPLTVPKKLIKLKTDTQSPNEPTKEDLVSVGQFDIWQFKQFEGLIGQFPINIKIEDNDLIKTGDQSVEIELPNVAETLAELTVKTVTFEAILDVLTNMGIRQLIQGHNTRLMTVKQSYALDAIGEYIGYESKKEMVELPTLINFPQDASLEDEAIDNLKFDKLLDSGTLRIEVEECIEKESLEQKLTTLIEAARIIKGTRYRKFTGDLGAGLVDTLRDLFSDYKDYDKTDEESFADFLERVEDGWNDTQGITDPTQPYGKPNKYRPKIRDLSKRSEEET